MQHDSALARLARASRPSRPLIHVTVSPRWARVLRAAGARPAATDSMSVSFRRSGPQKRGRQEAAPVQGAGGLTLPSMAMSGVVVVRPTTYSDGRAVGEHFREGRTVVLDLRNTRTDDAKRLVDFAAGLIFGRHGTIERVDSKIFRLTPLPVRAKVDTGASDSFLDNVDDLREDVAFPNRTGTATLSRPTRQGRKSASA